MNLGLGLFKRSLKSSLVGLVKRADLLITDFGCWEQTLANLFDGFLLGFGFLCEIQIDGCRL